MYWVFKNGMRRAMRRTKTKVVREKNLNLTR